MPDRSGWERRPGFDLSGKRALVVGAETEEGAAVARAFAEAGADVALVSATGSGDSLGAIQSELQAGGRRSFTDAWDVTDPATIEAGMQRLVTEFGAPSVLVAACDAVTAAPIEQTDDAAYRRTMAVVVDGTYYACRAFLRALPADAANARIICLTTVFASAASTTSVPTLPHTAPCTTSCARWRRSSARATARRRTASPPAG